MIARMTSTHYLIVGCVVLFGALIGWQYYTNAQPGRYDDLAACIEESGATFFGAFWCPHCNEQKQLFGRSADLLPYTECSMPDGQTQTQICIDEEIKSYPTWEFADGTRLSGTQQLATLAEKTGCELPE